MRARTSKFVVMAILAIAVVGGIIYFWLSTEKQNATNPAQLSTVQTEARPNLESYSSDKYSFQYPKEYKITTVGSGNTFILTVSKDEKSKLEIFKESEYPGDRAAIGFSGEETAAEAEALTKEYQARIAKEYLKIGNYDVWLYYNENDAVTKKELETIFSSIVIK